MSTLSKRVTDYIKSTIHKALKICAAPTNTSISEIVDGAVGAMMNEDLEDINSFSDRANESEISYEDLLTVLKKQSGII